MVERKIASHPGFAYSPALSAHSADTWTYDKLNEWLTSPKANAPGTKMTYAGDKDDTDRANIIAYLSTLSHSPKPFPQPAAPSTPEAPTSSQVETGISSVAPGAVVQTPATTDPNGTNAPGTGTTTNAPAGASEVTNPAASSAAPALSEATSSAASSSAAQ